MPTRDRPARVTVVMPTLNGAATIREQLVALADQDYGSEWELVVVDNGSTDETLAIVGEFAEALPALEVVEVPDRRGISRSCNIGANSGTGDFIVWCHQDDVAREEWLSAMAAAAREHDMVGGRLDDRSLNSILALSWRAPQPEGLPIGLRWKPYAVGANIGIWRDVFDATGGWNEDFTQGGEDIEFCWRVQLAGYSFGAAPDAVMAYRYRDGTEALWNQIYHYGFAEPQLYKTYRRNGVVRSNTWVAVKTWLWALVHLPDLRGSEEARGRYLRKVAYHWGRLRGSLAHRVLYL